MTMWRNYGIIGSFRCSDRQSGNEQSVRTIPAQTDVAVGIDMVVPSTTASAARYNELSDALFFFFFETTFFQTVLFPTVARVCCACFPVPKISKE